MGTRGIYPQKKKGKVMVVVMMVLYASIRYVISTSTLGIYLQKKVVVVMIVVLQAPVSIMPTTPGIAIYVQKSVMLTIQHIKSSTVLRYMLASHNFHVKQHSTGILTCEGRKRRKERDQNRQKILYNL
jgi:hypothetical protein